jgi:methyl-accepting chemotaxis protein
MQRDFASAVNAQARQADRLMTGILWGLFVMALFLAGLHDTWGLALWIGLPLALGPTLLALAAPGSRITRLAVGVAMMAFCALHIHQAAGRTELHFGIFVLLAFLLCYRDWSVIVAAAVVVALHHLSFNYMQELAYGPLCLSTPGLSTILVHAGYVVAESAVLCYLAEQLRRETLRAAELRVSVAAMTSGEAGQIDLRGNVPAAVSDSARALQDVIRRLNATLARVQDNAQVTASTSAQIAEGNADLAARTEQQGGSIKAIVQAMAELTAAVRQNAEHARHADALAGTASTVAARGGQVVAQVVQRMEAINGSSRKIADITAVIDGIAFQTNILALNAAVEAARAGEQGRGFAVVAGEVRNLAQRAAAAAREIKTLIEDSVTQVGAGSELVRQAGHTMQDVVDSVRQVSGVIGEISGASREQADGIAAISESVGAMDAATRSNAGIVEHAASAAADLRSRAEQLARAVAVFRLDTQTPAPQLPGPGRR